MDNTIRLSKRFKLSESYLKSLPVKVLWKLPFIVYGNYIMTAMFFLLACGFVILGHSWRSDVKIIGFISFIISFLFLTSNFLIRKEKIYTAVYLSTVANLFLVMLVVVFCPVSENSLVYYRSACFISVMAVCNQIVVLRRRQIVLFFICAMIMWAFSLGHQLSETLTIDFSGTISAILINTFGMVFENIVIFLLYKFNEKIINNAIQSEKVTRANLRYVTRVMGNTVNPFDYNTEITSFQER